MLRFCTAGESHGEALIAVVSGVPAGVEVDQEFVNRELWRRQQGYGRGGRMRIEQDRKWLLVRLRRELDIFELHILPRKRSTPLGEQRA